MTQELCKVCGRFAEFLRGPRSVREGFVCPHCKASLRYRHQASVIIALFSCESSQSIAGLVAEETFRSRRVYEPGLIGPFRTYLQTLPGYERSYFWEDLEPGVERNGVRCENLQRLTFPDDDFDLVITSDIFEHIRDPDEGFREILRVLKPGGYHVFTVPHTWPLRKESVSRVDISGSEDTPLVPTSYHSSPTDPRGSLVYTDFGLELEDRLDAMGFSTETHYGHRYNLTYSARKPPRLPDKRLRGEASRGPGSRSTSRRSTPRVTSRPLGYASASVERSDAGLIRICPVCNTKTDEFLPFAGDPRKQQRPNAKCASCGALERHRLVWLYLLNETDLFLGSKRKRILHVAPEPALFSKLRQEPLLDYVSADLDPTFARGEMETMDITSIQHPAESFDVIYCSHVLEHVPDDRKAMREFARVLKASGWAIILVPVLRAVTEEDSSVTDPAERSRRFGQIDHVRAYGPDFADRLADAGFDVTVDYYPRQIGPVRTDRYGLFPTDTIFFVRKRAGQLYGG